jgi:hypothetical protein
MANNTNLSYPLYYNQQFFDKNGNPLSNGKLYTYEAGTSTSIVTYKTIGEESSANMNTNPIILDSSGYAKLVVKKGLYYRFVLKDKNDSFVNEWDNVSSVDISSGSLSSIRIRGKDNEIDVEESESGGVKTFLIKLASHIKNVINGKKDKQEPLVFNGSAVKTIKKLIQNENGNVDVEFENIELPEPSWGVFKSAVLHTDTTAQHLHLTLDAYSGDSISLQSNAIKLGVGDYLVCGTLEIQGPTTPSPDYERITFGIFNSESSYDVDCSETAKKVIPFCTIVNNVTQNYSDMFDVQCTKAGVSVTLTSLTITAIVTNGGGGGSYTATYPLEIDGNDDIKLKYGTGLKVENDELVVDEDAIQQQVDDEIAEVVNSRVMYTMDIGAITDAITPSGNQSYCIGTLFNPNMDMEIDSNTNVIVATSQSGSGNHCYLALYELDLANGEYNWIANTADINSDIHTTGYHHYKFAYVKDNKFKLKTNKMYYFCLIGDMNSVRFTGSPITEPFNTVPLYLCWYADNLVANGQNVPSDAANIQNQLKKFVTSISPTPADPPNGIFSVGGISQNRCFAAFTNIVLN